MVKAAFVMIAALLFVGTLVAQGHDNAREKMAKADINIEETLRVGVATLPAGDYRVVCDREQVTFTRALDGQRFQFPCKGHALDKESEVTVTETAVDKNGVRYLAKLLLKGSVVEHIFD